MGYCATGACTAKGGAGNRRVCAGFCGRSAYWVGIRVEMVWGQVAPAVNLLHGLDKDAPAGWQQAEFVKVEAGDVAQAALRVGEQAQDAVGRVRSPTGCWTRKAVRAQPKCQNENCCSARAVVEMKNASVEVSPWTLPESHQLSSPTGGRIRRNSCA